MVNKTNQPAPKNDNGLAIAALVLGIVSFTGPGPLTGIPAIICGAISLKNPTNRGMGIAGLILGCISTLIALAILLFFLVLLLIVAASGSSDLPRPVPMNHWGDSSAVHQRI